MSQIHLDQAFQRGFGGPELDCRDRLGRRRPDDADGVINADIVVSGQQHSL